MAVYPGAKYRPLNQFSNRGTKPRLGVVLHVNDSNGPSLYNWIAGDNDMSCHFQVAKDGTVEQYIDTDNGSWCQMAGNDTYLSIETQGFPNEPLTDAQVKACAGIMRWANQTHGIPLVLAEKPGQRGLIWHGAGGAAWGGHPGCPGDLRKAQRAKILQLAAPAPAPAPSPAPKPTPAPAPKPPAAPASKPPVPAWPLPAGHYFGLITGPNQSHGGINATEKAYVKKIQERLQALGYAPKVAGWADGIYEQPTANAVAAWQRAKWAKYTSRYGEVWSDDWKRLFS